MEAVRMNNLKGEKAVNTEGVWNRIKLFLQKLAKAELVDVDALLNSEEWPHLWRK
jgi:hypothetical protein